MMKNEKENKESESDYCNWTFDERNSIYKTDCGRSASRGESHSDIVLHRKFCIFCDTMVKIVLPFKIPKENPQWEVSHNTDDTSFDHDNVIISNHIADFKKCTKLKKNRNKRVGISCALGNWSVSGGSYSEVYPFALHYYILYKSDGY